MEDIITEDGRMWFVDSDFVTGEGTEYLTISLENNVTKEVSSLWLKEDEVRKLIRQLIDWQSNNKKLVLSTDFFHKRDVKNVIFYNGENKQEVIDFFKEYNYGKFLTIREDGNLHYYLKQWQTKDETLIKPNRYLYFEYDEDNWWGIEALSKKDFERDFVSVKL